MKTIATIKIVGYVALLALLLGCITIIEKEADETQGEMNRCQSASPVKKVLIIGIDGCRTDALLAANSTGINDLMADGYVSLNCDRGSTNTLSGPGWSSVFHGVWPAKHGVVYNNTYENNYAQYPDLFYYLRQHNAKLNLASVVGWNILLDIISNENYSEYIRGDFEIKEKAVYLLNNCTPDVLFVHFEAVDSTGHKSGFSPTNPAYVDAINQSGNYISDIMSVVEQREVNFGEEWLVIVATDHGGFGLMHEEPWRQEIRYVFQIVRIPNMTRVDLPTARNTNIMPTILKYLDVPIDSTWGLDGTPLF